MVNKVFVYRNLQKNLWSIKDTRTGLVCDRRARVLLSDCELKVSQSGRARVLRDKRKNVHAGIKGNRLDASYAIRLGGNGKWVRVTYNPYKFDSFVIADTGQPIRAAKFVRLSISEGVFAYIVS
jgi:hypothetical protein